MYLHVLVLLQTMDAFYDKIVSPDHNGAAFFAVCRGKVSDNIHTISYTFKLIFCFLLSRSVKGWTLLTSMAEQ